MTTVHSRALWALLSASFVIALGYGIVAPALPQFARSFDVSVSAASAVISAFAGMRLLFAPMSGRLVQKLGERPVYLSGVFIVAVSTGLCAFAESYWQLLVLRSLGGIGSTMFTVSAMGLVIRIAPPDVRGRIAGMWTSSFVLGGIGGPLVGSLFVGFGLRVPFVVYAVALLLAVAVVYFALRDSELAKPQADSDAPTMSLRQALRHNAYRASLWTNFAVGWGAFGVRMALLPLFAVEVLKSSPATGGIALTFFAAGNAAVLIPAGRWADRFGRRPFLIAGSLVCGLATIAVGFADNLPMLFAASLIAGMGSGAMSPAETAVVADVIGAEARGGPVLAAFQMASDIGVVVGPVIAGALAQELSYASAFTATGAVLLVATGAWLLAPETLARNPDPDERADQVGRPDRDGAEQ